MRKILAFSICMLFITQICCLPALGEAHECINYSVDVYQQRWMADAEGHSRCHYRQMYCLSCGRMSWKLLRQTETEPHCFGDMNDRGIECLECGYQLLILGRRGRPQCICVQ